MSYAQIKRKAGQLGNLRGMLLRSRDTVERSVIAGKMRKMQREVEELTKGYIRSELAKRLEPFKDRVITPELNEMIVEATAERLESLAERGR